MTTPAPHRLCDPCRAASAKWLDYRMPPASPRLAASAAYDATPAGVAEQRRARFAAWRRVISEARAAIREGCQRGDHQPEQPEQQGVAP